MDSINDKQQSRVNVIALYERNYWLLLFDSIELFTRALELQEESKRRGSWIEDRYLVHTLARSSLLASIMMLETAANTCIQSLKLETSLFEDIERLPFLSKLDLFARIRFRGRKLDRGRTEVQQAQELKRLRDEYVHPKLHKVFLEISGKKRVRRTSSGRTPILGIAKNPSSWGIEDAVRGMAAVHKFLAYFFSDVCKYRPIQVTRLLLSEERRPSPEGEETGMPAFPHSAREMLQRRGVDFSYVKLFWYR